MPRSKNSSTCETCRKRKVRCDENTPICGQCAKAGRYCRRPALPETIADAGKRAKKTEAVKLPHPQRPRVALQNGEVSSLFFLYLSGPGSWYDLCDSQQHFATVVPQLALDNELLFCSVIALAAVQASRINAKALREVAEFYHGHCVRLLIELTDGDESLMDGTALAATCLLRSYEILHEDVDPNTHLQGAFSLASREGAIAEVGGNALLTAGFWNYLREDIAFSLFQVCPLKIDLAAVQTPLVSAGESHLHSMSLILGHIINAAFIGQLREPEWQQWYCDTIGWLDILPRHLLAFSTTTAAGEILPQIRFLQDYHASAMHYFLVASCILAANAPPTGASAVLNNSSLSPPNCTTIADTLEYLALQICGIAFTTNIPSVLVNAYGPISYCGQFIQDDGARDEVIRRLHASRKLTGWPVERLIQGLQVSWDQEFLSST